MKVREISSSGYPSPVTGHRTYKVFKYPEKISAGDALNVVMLPFIGTFDLGFLFICEPWQHIIIVLAPEGAITV